MVRLVIQKVRSSSVTVDGKTVGQIGPGLMVLIGVTQKDSVEIINKYAEKLLKLRVFDQISAPELEKPRKLEQEETKEAGTPKKEKRRWDSSVVENKMEVLVVSQFTLYGALNKGNKPDFHNALGPVEAEKLYNHFVQRLKSLYQPEKISTGIFGAMMEVDIQNSGPVTLIMDSASP